MKTPVVTAAIVPPQPAERIISLTMNEDVAMTLLCVTESIAGDPDYSRRRHTGQIGSALRAKGVQPAEGASGTIVFRVEAR